MDIASYLRKWIATADMQTSDRTDIFNQLAKIQLRMVAILVDFGKRKTLTEEIIELYQYQISRCINLKDLNGEIEWIDFFLSMCSEFSADYKDCIPNFAKMKEFLE